MISEMQAAIAATRFGLGARPGEIETARSDPQGWLAGQIGSPQTASLQGPLSSRDALERLRTDYREMLQRLQTGEGAEDEDLQQQVRMALRQPLLQAITARTGLAAQTSAPFSERWIRFWSNHFTVAANSAPMSLLAPSLETEIIRPGAFGRFEDLLVAVETHPAMLFYLDNASSVGPNSRAGRRRGRGLNENLAREALELHTLGVNGGYEQADVEALARMLTVWTIGNQRMHLPRSWGLSLFDGRIHEPGAQTMLGRRFEDTGEDQAPAALRFLAAHPSTQRFIARKLATHFLADRPAEADIAHLERAWADSAGDLAVMARAVTTAPSAFSPEPAKFKTPEEYLISCLRGLNIPALEPQRLGGALRALGQTPFTAPSPAGWPDAEAEWAGGDAVMKRLEFANAVAGRLGRNGAPRERGPAILGARLSGRTAQAVARAESAEQGLVLLLMSPEFLCR
jgi:uncharacterized protein (DUF1800 family)